jgi:GTPase SAR1 family protein
MTNTFKNFTEEKEVFMTYNVKRELEALSQNMIQRKQGTKFKTAEDKVFFLAHVHDEFLKKNQKEPQKITTAKLLLESPEVQEQLVSLAGLSRFRSLSSEKYVAPAGAGLDAGESSKAMRKGAVALFDMTHHRTDHLDSLQSSIKAYAAHYGIKNPGDAMMLSNGNKYDKPFLNELRTLMDPYLIDRATKAFLAKAAIEANKEETKITGLNKLFGAFKRADGLSLDNKAVAEIENTKNRIFEKGVRSLQIEDLKEIALKGASLQQDQLEKKSMETVKSVSMLTKFGNTVGNILTKAFLELPSAEFISTTSLAQKAVAQISRTTNPQQQHAYGV